VNRSSRPSPQQRSRSSAVPTDRRTKHPLRTIFDRLLAHYGPQHWWPGDTDTEVVIGAILTQNTAWTNVERAIDGLQRAGCLSFDVLHGLSTETLETLIRPSGTYRVKARRLKAFVDVLFCDFAGALDALLAGELEAARRRLTSIHGIGPETADAILLYAGKRATFVVDAYTKRVLRRHHLLDDHADYETTRALFHNQLPDDVPLFNEYHALLVAVGKHHCRTKARCAGCPLEGLPHDSEP